MKRLLTFLFLFIFLCALPLFSSQNIFNNKHISKAIIISKNDVEFDENLKIVSGNQFYYTLQGDFEKESKNFNSIDGVVLYFDNYSLENLIKDYKIDFFKGQNVDNYEIFYGFTNIYKDFVYLNSKKVNVQIAVKENQIIVGFPAILTGF